MRSGMFVCVAVSMTVGLSASGCFSLSTDCDLFLCPSGSTGTTSGTGAHGGGGGGTGGSTPAGCIPSDNVDAVGDACGVFVSTSLGAS